MTEKKTNNTRRSAKIKGMRSEIPLESFAEEVIRNFEDRVKPVPADYIKMLARKLIDYSMHPDSYSFYGFLTKIPHSRNQIYEWARKHPVLEHALDVARGQFALKRENRAAEDRVYATVYNKTASVYDYDLKDHLIEMERVKASINSPDKQGQVINVIIPPTPSTSLVPERNE